MTLHQVASQLHTISLAGYFNGEKFSQQRLEDYISAMFRGTPKAGNRIVMEIALPDGRWFFTINRYGDGYDYTIPNNRDEEARILALLS